jgi:hypothetical protein
MSSNNIEEHIDNLRFLLSTSDKSFYDWASKMDDDDLFYAQHLLEYHTRFISNRIAIIKEERRMNQCARLNHYFYADKILADIRKK